MRTLPLLASLIAIISQVAGDATAAERTRRSVAALGGELPWLPVKRGLSSLARSGELALLRPDTYGSPYSEEEEDDEDDTYFDKRYIGSLARAGGMRSEEKRGFGSAERSAVEGLVRGLATGEELKRLRLEALKEELYRERQEEAQSYDPEKREWASLSEEEDVEKRGLPSLLRPGRPLPGRYYDDDVDDKRSVASLAASGYPTAYSSGKRNIQSLVRDGAWPMGEGKRHLGSLVRVYGQPGSYGSGEKRSLASLAKNRDFPFAFEKRDSDEVNKRYVAALLRQGRLPVGEGSRAESSEESQEESKEGREREKKSVEKRSKRQAYGFGPIIDKTVDFESPIFKKYMGVRGGSKVPGSRLALGGGSSRRNNGRRQDGRRGN